MSQKISIIYFTLKKHFVNSTVDTIFLLVHNPAVLKINFHAKFQEASYKNEKVMVYTPRKYVISQKKKKCTYAKMKTELHSNRSVTISQVQKSLCLCLFLNSARSPRPPPLSGLLWCHLGLTLGCDNPESVFVGKECGCKLTGLH